MINLIKCTKQTSCKNHVFFKISKLHWTCQKTNSKLTYLFLLLVQWLHQTVVSTNCSTRRRVSLSLLPASRVSHSCCCQIARSTCLSWDETKCWLSMSFRKNLFLQFSDHRVTIVTKTRKISYSDQSEETSSCLVWYW